MDTNTSILVGARRSLRGAHRVDMDKRVIYMVLYGKLGQPV